MAQGSSDAGGAPDGVAGILVGRYELIEKIGRGGMGVVYLARDTQLGRTVAIKSIAGDHVPSRSELERFRQEVANLAAVTHPYVAAVYDAIDDGGKLYIVMEHVRGKSLDAAAAVDRRPRTIARWAHQIADALAGIHAAGIVHRDLKPSNVMVSEGGHIKVLDFGIAQRFTAQVDPDDETGETVEKLTRQGVAVGTPSYMSPEQLRQERLDPRSDLFSLGILLYEALTGVHPFRRASPAGTAAAILAGAPGDGVEPAELVKAGPLRHVVLRLLEKERERRYPGAKELVAALDTVPHGNGGRWWRLGGIALATLASVALAIVATRMDWPRRAQDPVLTSGQQQLLDRARALGKEHRYREAIEVLDTELAKDPKLLAFEALRATTLWSAGNELRAHEVIAHAQALAREQGLDPKSRLGLEIERARARILRSGPEVLAATEALARQFPDTPGIQVEYAEALADQGRMDEALAMLDRQSERDPLDADALLAKGTTLAAAGRRNEAQAAFAAAEQAFRSLAVPTGVAAVETQRGVIAFAVDKQPGEALEHFRQATALYRAAGQPPLEAYSRYQESAALLMSGDLTEAMEGFVEAQSAATENGDLSLAAVARNSHAVALIRAGRPTEAEPLLHETIGQATLLGDFGLSLSARGNLVALQLMAGEYDKARHAATESIALAQKQDDAAGYELTFSLNLAEVDLQQGKTDTALAEMEQILAEQKGPKGSGAGRAEASATLGNALLALERYDEALPSLMVAVEGWQQAGDGDQLGFALASRAYARAARGELDAARGDLDAAVSAAGSSNAGVAQSANYVDAFMLWKDGHGAQAAARLAALRQRADATGQRPLALDAAILESAVQRTLGDRGAALSLAREAASQATFSEPRRVRARAAEAEALAALGRRAEARSLAQDTAAAARQQGLDAVAERMSLLTK